MTFHCISLPFLVFRLFTVIPLLYIAVHRLSSTFQTVFSPSFHHPSLVFHCPFTTFRYKHIARWSAAIAARPATVRGAPRCTVQLSCGVLPSGALFHIECRRMLRHSRAKRALPRHCSGRNGRNRMGCIACGRAGRKVNRTWGGDYEKLKVRHGAADFAAMQELHLLRCYRAGRPSAEPDPALVKVTGSMSLLFACCAPVSPALSAFLVSNRTCFGRKTA